MLRSYLRLALRTLRRNISYAVVNTVGLTVGLACCALAAVFLQHELTWDAHHANADRIYRIVSDRGMDTFSSIRFQGYNSNDDDAAEQRSLVRRLPEAIPEVEQAASYTILDNPLYVETTDGDKFASDRQLVTNTGPSFAKLFTFERLSGAPLEEALSEPGSVVLTRSTAQKYFGTPDPTGKTLKIGAITSTVEAVIADPPSNSRIQFDLALQLKRLPNWAAFHYVRLAEGADPEAVAPKVSEVMDEVNPNRVDDENLKRERLQALTDIYLADRALYDAGPHRDVRYLWAFGAIGLLVLVITTINYANLALALYADRNAEIGVRKAVGGHSRQIAGQFLVEAVVLAILCVPVALAACAAALPAFNDLMSVEIAATRLLQPSVLGTMLGLAALTGLIAGGYPAIVLTKRRAVDLFDRAVSSGGTSRGWSLRQGLIALQFVVLIGLGSLSWIAYDQLEFMQEDSLNMPTETVVRIPPPPGNDSARYQQLRPRLLKSSAVQAVGMGEVPRSITTRSSFSVTGSDRIYEGGMVEYVDVHWFDVMGIEHPAIKKMKEQGATAPSRILINETAAELLETENPVGETWINDPDGPRDTGSGDNSGFRIAGVIPDVHLHSMRREVPPTAFRVTARPQWALKVLVRFAPGRTQEGMQHVREVWAERRPDTPFQASFFSERITQLYEQERRFGTLSASLTILAILMAGIGLASLVAYLTRLRKKEIGVRKALGGSTFSIITLLNKEYVQIVAVAFLVAAPVAWVTADWWLSQFASRIGISPFVFLGSGLAALAIAVAAVSVQALRAAQVDPAQVLRSE
jgi:putative ABC transport system permease protein